MTEEETAPPDETFEEVLEARIREAIAEVTDEALGGSRSPEEVAGLDALAAVSEVPAGEARAAVDQAVAAIESSERARQILRKVVEPDPVEVVVAAKALGRVTGWVVICSECGAMNVAAPSQSAAVHAAGTHLEIEHRGRPARIVKRDLGRPRRRRGGRGRAA